MKTKIGSRFGGGLEDDIYGFMRFAFLVFFVYIVLRLALAEYFHPTLSPVQVGTHWGITNSSGDWIIKPRFAEKPMFHNGWAPVNVNGKWGFLRADNLTYFRAPYAIEPTFEGAGHFGENQLAAVKEKGKWGYINQSGEFVIKPAFDEATPFMIPQAAAVLQDGKWGFVKPDGTWLEPPRYQVAHPLLAKGTMVKEGDGWVYLDRHLKPVNAVNPSDFSQNLNPVQGGNGNFGYMDPKGIWKIPPLFRQARPFHEGLAAVMPLDSNLFGFINASASWVITPRVPQVDDFFENLAAAADPTYNKYWGFLDRQGEWWIGPRLDGAKRFREGLAPAGWKYRRSEFFHLNMLPRQSDPHRSLKTWWKRQGSDYEKTYWGYIGTGSYQFVIPPLFESTKPFENGNGEVEFAILRLDEEKKTSTRIETFYIERDGAFAVDPEWTRYGYSEGLAPVQLGKKWGYIDRYGSFRIPPVFDRAEPFKNGRAEVFLGGTTPEWDPTTSPRPAGKPATIDHEGSFIGEAPGFDSVKEKLKKLTVTHLTVEGIPRHRYFLISEDGNEFPITRAGKYVSFSAESTQATQPWYRKRIDTVKPWSAATWPEPPIGDMPAEEEPASGRR